MLGTDNKIHHKNYLLFSAAVGILSTRTIMGILYSFAILPYPIALPFAGNVVIDTIGFTLLLICLLENKKINEYISIEFIPVEKILGTQDTYDVIDEDGDDYVVELYEDEVEIFSYNKDRKIRCKCNWYKFLGREFCALKIMGKSIVVILEYVAGSWIPLKETESHIWDYITKSYREDNIPNSMEEAELDETEDYEI